MTKQLLTTRVSYSKEQLKKRADKLGMNVSQLVDCGISFMLETSPYFQKYVLDGASEFGMSPYIYLEKMLFGFVGKQRFEYRKHLPERSSPIMDLPDRFAFSIPEQGEQLINAVYDQHEVEWTQRRQKEILLTLGTELQDCSKNPEARLIVEKALHGLAELENRQRHNQQDTSTKRSDNTKKTKRSANNPNSA